MKWYIYSLIDPRDGRIRYVGKTINVKKRLIKHVYDALHQQKRNHRLNWIHSLAEGGRMPSLSMLESGEGDWQEAEKRWIKNFRDAGYELVNATDGGDGAENPSAEARARMSDSHKGHTHTAESRAKVSSALKGHPVSAEARTRLSAAAKGRTLSADTRAKMSVAAKGKTKSSETRARMSVAQKARAAEISSQTSTRNKIRWQSPENRTRQSATIKAVWAMRKAKNNEVSP